MERRRAPPHNKGSSPCTSPFLLLPNHPLEDGQEPVYSSCPPLLLPAATHHPRRHRPPAVHLYHHLLLPPLFRERRPTVSGGSPTALRTTSNPVRRCYFLWRLETGLGYGWLAGLLQKAKNNLPRIDSLLASQQDVTSRGVLLSRWFHLLVLLCSTTLALVFVCLFVCAGLIKLVAGVAVGGLVGLVAFRGGSTSKGWRSACAAAGAGIALGSTYERMVAANSSPRR